ncbi:hypothetical protein [Acidisoma cladoniae]|jgi:hypothetical protein|uniref:hypothetical protein n=1 Tax=Acidisoma cladoniae TaxID=3040935 RepID=UPI00254C3152|nr:hypothetical protein [Acidisoma sp. PAMC 29798]
MRILDLKSKAQGLDETVPAVSITSSADVIDNRRRRIALRGRCPGRHARCEGPRYDGNCANNHLGCRGIDAIAPRRGRLFRFIEEGGFIALCCTAAKD